ncbi:MAG: hypothetical protein M1832_003625 [Thelocarpon impressellum]|nr:MAG: hypothetical protein M1832_003625 [Thelocarpon impressellum]
MAEKKVTPEVTWAQRSSSTEPTKNYVWLTIMAPDVDKSSLKLDLKPTGLTFAGYSATKKLAYEVELEFYAEIDVENSKTNHTARDLELVLRKKELKEDYWPRLLKDSKKVHFLKTDFDKWVDEDEQDEVADEVDPTGGMGGMPGMPGMGGMGGMGGMPGMEGLGGMGGMPGMGDIDFSKLGGDGGMDGMPDLGDMGDMEGDEDGDDEDMPGLEGEGDEEGDDENAVPADADANAKVATGDTGASATKTSKIEELS